MSLKILWFRVDIKFLITILYAYLPVLRDYDNGNNCKNSLESDFVSDYPNHFYM